MNYFQAIGLGLVEGITEFLPISSTGHLIIVSKLFGLPQTDSLKTFIIGVQFFAILSIVAIYARKLAKDFSIWKLMLAGFIPAAVVGLFLYPFIKGTLLSSISLVAWALIGGGVAMLVLEKRNSMKITPNIPVSALGAKNSFLIGLFQVIAMIPGVSRSGATILGGMSLGLPRAAVAEFSFLLALPTMGAATLLDVWESRQAIPSLDWGPMLAGGLAAFVSAVLVVRWLVSYVQKNDFSIFGWYRILVGVLMLIFIY